MSLNDAETFSNRRGLWMGPVDGRVTPSPMSSWEPLKVMEKGRFQDRAGNRQQARSGVRKSGWALGWGELGAGQGACVRVLQAWRALKLK